MAGQFVNLVDGQARQASVRFGDGRGQFRVALYRNNNPNNFLIAQTELTPVEPNSVVTVDLQDPDSGATPVDVVAGSYYLMLSLTEDDTRIGVSDGALKTTTFEYVNINTLRVIRTTMAIIGRGHSTSG